MSESTQHVEALIERGLTLYENGDIDSAVLAWEQALALEPANGRANGYVDYVRLHYEVLSGAPVEEAAADEPFGISTTSQPAYRIALAPFGASPLKVGLASVEDGIDEGWFLEAEGLAGSAQDMPLVNGAAFTGDDTLAGAEVSARIALSAGQSAHDDEVDEVDDDEDVTYSGLQLAAPGTQHEPGPEYADAPLTKLDVAGPDSLAVLDELDFGITAQRTLAPLPSEPAGFEPGSTQASGEIDNPLSTNPFAQFDYSTAPFESVITAAAEADQPPGVLDVGVLEFDADEPASDSYSASYAQDLDASFGIMAPAMPGPDSAVGADDSDLELTIRSEVPRAPAIVMPGAGLEASAESSGDFESEGTGVLQRDNGFVAARARRASNAPQLKMTLRTPTSLAEIDLDDVEEANSGLYEEPVAAITARAQSRLTSQLSGLAQGPLPARVDPVAPVVDILAVTAVANGRGRTRSDLFPVKVDALIPPAAARTEDLSQRALLAIAAFEPDDDAPPELVIESLEPSADDSRYDLANPDDEFEVSGPVDQTVNLTRAATEFEAVLPFDPVAAGAAALLLELDATGRVDETNDDFVRRRITGLLALAAQARSDGELERMVTAIELALSQDPASALGQKLVHRHRDAILAGLQQYLGDMNHYPRLAKPMNELGGMQIGPRAAFLVSRIDGGITYDELLDVSGMPRMEALRYLCQMVMRGVLA